MVGSFRKKYIVLFFMCALTAASNFAGSDEELFLRGNKQYEQKDYDGAFRSYDAMSKKGRAVVYNMGNCAFHKGDYAQALVYWSRAEVGATPQEYKVISHNKKRVADIVGKQDNNSFKYAIVTFIHNALPYATLFFLQLFFLLCWYMFIFLVRKKQQTKIQKTTVGCLSLFMAIFGSVIMVHYSKQGSQNGLIVKKEAQLFVGPDKGLCPLCPLVYAHGVAVKEAREGWYKVRYAGMIGWVEADVVQII